MLQECLTLCDPMDCSQPGSYIHGILQASILEWVAKPFTRGSSWPRMWTCISCMAGVFFFFFFFTTEPLEKPLYIYIHISSVQSFSHVRLSATPWTAAPQASLSITNTRSLLSSCPSSQWCHPTISSSELSLSSCLNFPNIRVFPMSQFVTSGDQSIWTSASVLPMNIQDLFPLDWLVWSPCSPRDSQESFPAPEFKSINSSMLSFLYGSSVLSIPDNWKNHSFD